MRVDQTILSIAMTISTALPIVAVALELPETLISYEIRVTLDPQTRMLEGRETIRWQNPSQRAIEKVPLHLYLNGFAHEDTTWMSSGPARQFRLDDLLEVYGEPWGWIEPGVIRQGTDDLEWAPIAPDDGNVNDRSLIEVTLARPVLPGEILELTIDFEARLPIPIARTGGYEDFFFVAQWFPKVSAFETAGIRGAVEDRWAGHQFHGPTEFYADYADFDVLIGVPEGWTVAATGERAPTDETGIGEFQWHRYRQRAVHDFAFATGEHMMDSVSTHQPEGSGGAVEIHIFTPSGTEHQTARWRRAVEGSLDILGARVGPYPYQTITLVLPPHRALAVGGMEYPTLITGIMGDPLWDVGFLSSVRVNEMVIAHEFAHQFFYGIVGTNEFEEAYLDEGFTEHWGNEAMIGMYGDESGGGTLFGRTISISGMERAGLRQQRSRLPPIWSGPSYLARGYSIGTQFYTRPATTLRTAASLFGRERMDRVFAGYYERWAFRHPRFEDFLVAARDVGGDQVADFIQEAFTQTNVPDYRVDSLGTRVWSSPRGRLVTEAGVIEPGSTRAGSLAGLNPAAREEDGLIAMKILDPGWRRGSDFQPGSIARRAVMPVSGRPDEDWVVEEDRFHVSRVRLQGPGWHHLPVDVHFRFADGAVVRETWDGRAPYRHYEFLRAAPLSEVRIDPDDRLAVDGDPVNNGRLRVANQELVNDWSAWFGGVFQLLLEGLSLCL